MKELPNKYDHKEAEKRWQETWEKKGIYHWDENSSRDESYVIDTPPPTVSGVLHMGHIFSYTQADFVARYQRMKGKQVFYPMGFDDNGLPTERLVEKVKKVRASDLPREEFIKLCEEVTLGAEEEFRALFRSVALSVDWRQEYQTISEESRKLSQMSFLDLYNKGHAYRKLQPMLWDPVDQTAIAQAEVEDKELPSHMNEIIFYVSDESPSSLRGGEGDAAIQINTGSPRSQELARDDGEMEKIIIATTRPELLPACVAVFYHPDDKRYTHLKNKTAITPLFGVKVPIIADDMVQMDKGTGLVMCCTFGDEQDIRWWEKYDLPLRIILNKYGKIDFIISKNSQTINFNITNLDETIAGKSSIKFDTPIHSGNCVNIGTAIEFVNKIEGKRVSNKDPKHSGAREIIIDILKEQNLLLKQEPITHTVKCAERSGAPLEIIPTNQWFVKILDKKEELKKKGAECKWYPDYMRIRLNQWIDGLNWDWCISRQRYSGVPFPVWYVEPLDNPTNCLIKDDPYPEYASLRPRPIIASPNDLPVNPLQSLPRGLFSNIKELCPGKWEAVSAKNIGRLVVGNITFLEIEKGTKLLIEADTDIMDTWATSSVSPQLNSKAICAEYAVDYERHQKLFPADLRPQAHEIIRTWAFYTIVKAHLHENTIPWKNLMISGWCLASDKTKMSKSKGNVVTPVGLIQEQSADAVRFWASTSRLGADTAFSEDVLKIGKKLVTKLWNATKFASQHLNKLDKEPESAKADIENGVITEALDKWIITRLHRSIKKADEQFALYEYSSARAAVEDFFWNDFCDNYLEMVKARAYGEKEGITKEQQMSAVHTLHHCLEALLKLFAPFVPHITDELYSHIFDKRHEKIGSIHARGTWPEVDLYPVSEQDDITGTQSVSVINVVRQLRASKNISLAAPMEEVTITASSKDSFGFLDALQPAINDLKNVTNAERFFIKREAGNDGSSTEDGALFVKTIFAEKDS